MSFDSGNINSVRQMYDLYSVAKGMAESVENLEDSLKWKALSEITERRLQKACEEMLETDMEYLKGLARFGRDVPKTRKDQLSLGIPSPAAEAIEQTFDTSTGD